MGVTERRIDLRIEELVLHGLDPSDRAGLREVIERELARLFAERGAPPSLATRGRRFARLEHAATEVPAGSRADRIGAQVARTLYENPSGGASQPSGRAAVDAQAPAAGSLKK